jgi:hypothetical protein
VDDAIALEVLDLPTLGLDGKLDGGRTVRALEKVHEPRVELREVAGGVLALVLGDVIRVQVLGRRARHGSDLLAERVGCDKDTGNLACPGGERNSVPAGANPPSIGLWNETQSLSGSVDRPRRDGSRPGRLGTRANGRCKRVGRLPPALIVPGRIAGTDSFIEDAVLMPTMAGGPRPRLVVAEALYAPPE